MFERSREKIVASIMTVLSLLFIGTLAVIYICSFIEVSNSNFEMLERHAERYELSHHMEGYEFKKPSADEHAPKHREGHEKKPFNNDMDVRPDTLYSVAKSKDGSILATDVGLQDEQYAETLEMYAESILDNDEDRGKIGNLIYLAESKDGYELVVFMDNTIINDSITALFRYTFIFGGAALIFLFFVSFYLAKQIIQPLEEKDIKQKQFISDAGHELKTPVSVISANADLLRREIGENQWLDNICYENERMEKLIRFLLELAKTENFKPVMENTDFSRIVVGGVLPFESLAFEKGLTINMDISENIIINGNRDQLSQMVSVLIDNAIRYSRNGKIIEVSLAEKKGEAVLSVINSGEPIPAEKIPRIFERFYRIDETRNGEDRHYGLGLSIAEAVVSAHNGKIEVSCSDGKICFSVRMKKI